MSLRAEIITVPGIASVDNAHPSPEEPYDGAIDDFFTTPGIAGTNIEVECYDAIRFSAEGNAEAFPGWEALRHLLTGEHHTVADEDQQPVELESYWLTLPDVEDASVELKVSDEESTDTSASLTIAGIGGGPQFSIDLQEELSHKVARCEKVLLSTIATFQKIVVTRQGEVIGTYPRLVALSKDRLDWSFRPTTPPNAANLGIEVFARSYDQSSSDGATTVSLGITRGTSWNISMGLALPNLGGIKANISTKVTYKKAIGLRYELPARHRYKATMYKAIPAYIWTVPA